MSSAESRPDKIAKQLFFVGLAGLPWLWIVNIFYFFDRVYGRIPCFGDVTKAGTTNGDDNNVGMLGLMADDGEDANGNTNGDGNADDLSEEEIQIELCKWVKRSTIGSFISSAIFFSWVLAFQLNRDSFGPKWFVYAPGNEILTGW